MELLTCETDGRSSEGASHLSRLHSSALVSVPDACVSTGGFAFPGKHTFDCCALPSMRFLEPAAEFREPLSDQSAWPTSKVSAVR